MDDIQYLEKHEIRPAGVLLVMPATLLHVAAVAHWQRRLRLRPLRRLTVLDLDRPYRPRPSIVFVH
ncbi:hypothetical protein WK07_07145 [Burkholderia multivorans]|nr:hypothetical protein WK07_07145 [Burkholderia multivorans]